jgi:hypothetical protein
MSHLTCPLECDKPGEVWVYDKQATKHFTELFGKRNKGDYKHFF